MNTARQALQRLIEGNRRFVAGESQRDAAAEHDRRMELLSNQEPFAIVLGCSDSRVPAEIVFDQGLGDLFVIRVAGNIIAPSQIGSVEFAAERFGVRLVVVMGHSGCGAVVASLEALQQQVESNSPNLGFIVNRIKPGLEKLLQAEPGLPPDRLLARAVRENIRVSLEELRSGSELLETLISDQGLMILGAEYSLETGAVEFFDEPV
jgi:carbonic anhydrase